MLPTFVLFPPSSKEVEDMALEDLPPYSMVSLTIGEEDAALTIMLYGKRFHIEFTIDDLLGAGDDASDLIQQYEHYWTTQDQDPSAIEDLERWLIEPCLSRIRRLAPALHSVPQLSLYQYFDPPTFYFRLSSAQSRLIAKESSSDEASIAYLSPKLYITNDLEWIETVKKDRAISRSRSV